MQFHQFAEKYLQPLEDTSKKLAQTELLAQMFSEIAAEEIDKYLYLLLGQMGPNFRNPQFQFGVQFMLYSLAELQPLKAELAENLFGEAVNNVAVEDQKKLLSKRYKRLGDIGLLAEEVLKELVTTSHNSTFADLTVPDVFDRLWQITEISGEGSQEEKIHVVAKLLRQLQPLSARYVARILLGDMRLGVSDKTILDALSWYMAGDKSQRHALDEVYQRHPDIGVIAQHVRSGGIEAARKLDVALGTPILPALCDRLKTTEEMIEKMGKVIAEPKYDGTRVQIHWDARTETVKTFTRNLDENSEMFPELKQDLLELPVESVIFDAEAVGYDPETDQLVNFQTTIKRKRKHGVAEMAETIPLRFFVFDVLFKDGQSQMHIPLDQRKEIIEHIISAKTNTVVVAPYITTSDPIELKVFHEEQLTAGLEGAVIKKSHGEYLSGRQSFNWVKLKEKEGSKAKLTDTIDAIVLGYYYGRGKRTQFGIGAFFGWHSRLKK
ncbi:ATP-dependent DNA ligase [Candidatus Woesebacteria bacterium]|nr:ATP-dependent DNA ligase [Candidatus Woesebacteria bacterium]